MQTYDMLYLQLYNSSATMSRYGGGGGGRSSAERGCKVYIGNLGSSASKTEIEREFSPFGPLKSVWIARNPPGFAFVEYEDPRDASDAVKDLDSRYQSFFHEIWQLSYLPVF